jgi:SAM-dependent methyltransferase
VPKLLEQHDIAPCRVLDIGCGTGGTLIWLGKRGFECWGVDLAPTAIKSAQEQARKEGVSATLLVGSFPDQFGKRELPRGAFPFVMERGFLHLNTGKRDHDRVLRGVVDVLSERGLFYSLIAKREGATWFGGPPKWRYDEVVEMVSPHLDIVEIRADVFTPGEVGSMPAWVCVFRKRS